MKLYFLLLTFCISIANLSAQKQTGPNFNAQFERLLDKKVFKDNVDYASIKKESTEEIYKALDNEWSRYVDSRDIRSLSNAYNFLVIYSIVDNYPIKSVKDVSNFFDKKFKLGDDKISLDQLEQDIVEYAQNPAMHFILNCGAQSCPPLIFIDNVSDLDSLTVQAFQTEKMIQVNDDEGKIYASKILLWNEKDFDQAGGPQTWLNSLLNLDNSYALDFHEYDWRLNDLNSDIYLIYYPTRLFAKGAGELKIFNNYYTQSDNGFRSNFFTSFIQLLIGTDKNLNFGLDVKLRSVNSGDVGLFSALQFKDQPFFDSNGTNTFSRVGISGIGPRIKYQPIKNKGNLNFLHAVYFVPMEDAEGNDNYGYSDFGNLQIYNNVFYEIELSAKKRLFFDLGFHIENLKLGVHRNENHFTQFQVPLTAIYSYFPNQKTTFYGLANVALRPVLNFAPNTNTKLNTDAYAQFGAGAKYYLTDFLEVEGLYTYFLDATPGRFANTFNIGLRFYRLSSN